MSYAVRMDGLGWRAVDSQADVLDGEYYSDTVSDISLNQDVPGKVTMRQARLALHASGLLVGVEAAIEALEDPPKTEARIEWDFSSEVHRNKPFVAMLTTALGLTEQEVDDLFTLAATL